jgi:acetyl esterase
LPTRTNLTLGERLGVILWRSMLLVYTAFVRLRPLGTSERVGLHAYGTNRAETLVHIPAKTGVPSQAPVVYIHGGGWICGKKEMYTRDLVFLSEVGYPVFNLEYPLAPEHPHPHILRSLLGALKWIRANHPGCDSVHLIGDSVGGNLAAMLGLLLENPELLKDVDSALNVEELPRIRSVTSLYGVLDRLSWIEHGFPSSRLMLLSYGGKAAFESTVGPDLAITPMDLAIDRHPPILIAAASKDELAESSRLYAERLGSDAKDVTYKLYEGESHGFFNMSWRPASQELRTDMLDFLSVR